MAMLLIGAALAAASPVDGLTNARVLEPYFEKLARARGRNGRPVHILQIGDSHTAGDTITGAWRDILQARYGVGGRGVLPPGRPYDGYITRGVTAQMSGNWSIASIFGRNSGDPRPVMGLSGFSLTAQAAGARMSLTADPAQAFDRFTICAAAARGAGALSIRMGFTNERMRLGSATARPECRTVTSNEPRLTVEVVVEEGPVTITSWGTFRDDGGVALSNLGVVGSQLVHLARTDDAAVTEELRAYRPDLIVVAFGTNEGFSPIFRPAEYEIVLRSQISRIRRLAGGVPILLLGAPDASSRRPEMLRNAAVATPAPCLEPVTTTRMASASPAPAAQVAQAGRVDSDPLADVMADLRATGEGDDPAAEPPMPVPVIAAPPPPAPAPVPVTSTSWRVGARPLFPPAGLGAVRAVQRRVAAQLNLAFWDWEARMGGRCSAVRWVKGTPPLMRGDYVHFNSAGGREIGSRLQADLDRAATTIR